MEVKHRITVSTTLRNNTVVTADSVEELVEKVNNQNADAVGKIVWSLYIDPEVDTPRWDWVGDFSTKSQVERELKNYLLK